MVSMAIAVRSLREDALETGEGLEGGFLEVLWQFVFGLRAVARLLAAFKMISSGETAGFVIYLCLWKTVTDILCALVPVTHRFQQR